MIEQLQKEREGKLARVKSKLELISKLLEFENADAGKVPSVTPPEALPPLGNVAPTPLARAIGFKKVS